MGYTGAERVAGKPVVRYSRFTMDGQYLAFVQGTIYLPSEGALKSPSLRGISQIFVVFQVLPLGLEKLPTTEGKQLSKAWVPNREVVVFNLDARKFFL